MKTEVPNVKARKASASIAPPSPIDLEFLASLRLLDAAKKREFATALEGAASAGEFEDAPEILRIAEIVRKMAELQEKAAASEPLVEGQS